MNKRTRQLAIMALLTIVAIASLSSASMTNAQAPQVAPNAIELVGTVTAVSMTSITVNSLTIDISKAVQVNEQFQVTRQFWAYAVENGLLPDVRSFLTPIPHVSFVKGEANIDFLKRRHEALVDNPLFASMEFIASDDEFERRLPLMAAGRSQSDPLAMAWAQGGTDVDFGALARHTGKRFL